MKRRKNDTRTDVLHEIREFLKKRYGVQPSNVNMYTNLRTDLGMDSFEATDLSVELYELYGVNVSDEALNGNIADIVEDIME